MSKEARGQTKKREIRKNKTKTHTHKNTHIETPTSAPKEQIHEVLENKSKTKSE